MCRQRRRPLGVGATLTPFASLAEWLSGIAGLPSAQASPRHILVAYDRSEHAEAAFDDALDLTELSNARLSVLSVATPPEPAHRVDTMAFIQGASRHGDIALVRLCHGASLRGIAIDTHVSAGYPAEQILQFAASAGVDLIVVGHRGRSHLHERRLGSTSRTVVDAAPCAVLVVKAR